MPDYFPLVKGRVLEYRSRTPDGERAVTTQVLSVADSDGRRVAECQRTTLAAGEPPTTRRFTVVADGAGVVCGGDLEFPVPASAGRTWKRYPREYSIESLEGEVATPSGAYRGCLVVVYSIAGGDAGFGRRYYAPGVGFVYESCADEADPYELALARIAGP